MTLPDLLIVNGIPLTAIGAGFLMWWWWTIVRRRG